ncbi:MAG: PD40 domain-containing protein [Chloroflexi bacterium]|nr:PD40 domain-containing protein [Chloroflexota bacterium]
MTPPVTAAPTALPISTPNAYITFVGRLKAAVETNDEAALKNLIGPVWFAGRYRQEATQYKDTGDAVAAFRALRQGATVVVDVDRTAIEPVWQNKIGDRIIVARWQTRDGSEEFAHLYVSSANGEWRWVALVTGIPYYRSPTIAMIRGNPKRYAGRDVMLAGEIRTAGSDRDFKDTPPEGYSAFVLRDASGGALWVALKAVPGQEVTVKPGDPALIGRLVRIIGPAQNGPGSPFIIADSVSLTDGNSYANVTGTIKEAVAGARTITLTTAENTARSIVVLATTVLDYADGRTSPAPALSPGVRILAVGRPSAGSLVLAEQIFLLPASAQAATALTAANHIAFMRGGKVLLFDLGSHAETGLAEGGTQWDWNRDGTRAVFVRGAGTATEVWAINYDGSHERQLTNNTSGFDLGAGSPRWSPDGSQIVYERNLQYAGGTAFKIKGEIWLMNADGSHSRKIANGYDPAWAPDGQRIAFASNPTVVKGDPKVWTSYSKNGIQLVNAQGKNEWTAISTETTSGKFTPLQWQMPDARLVDSPVWSPDGREIMIRVSDGHGTYVSTDSVRGGFGAFWMLFYDDIARGFSYSPDGGYVTVATGGQSGWETVGVFNRSTGKDGLVGPPLRSLGRIARGSDSGQNVVGFDWAPDSRRIVYALSSPNADPNKAEDSLGIWLLDVASGETKQIIADGTGPLFWLP